MKINWNFGDHVRSRDFQYLLHCVSVKEKDEIMSALWEQHTEEMKMLEGNILNFYNKECTVEFQPGADMSWQSWAANELNQAATYPSPYANVHKGNMGTLGGSIGVKESDTWQPFSMTKRISLIEKVSKFIASLPPNISEQSKNSRKLQFMAENGIRQLGHPRIGVFVDRLRPEPMHCEINAWQHYLDLLYLEAIHRHKFEAFISVLGASIGSGDHQQANEKQHPKASLKVAEIDSVGERARKQEMLQQSDINFKRHIEQAGMSLNISQKLGKGGCGLGYVASRIREHFNDESKWHTKLPVRLIGNQAIALARYAYRLVDTLCSDECGAQKIKRLVLGKVGEYLRDSGGLFNRIETNAAQVAELKEVCEMYFNLIALFFPSSINVTTWTVGYAIPYHAQLLFEQYKVGYGIVSLQAKEAKHSGIKEDLTLTNRSTTVSSHAGKWWQVMRSNYVRSFYLPEHQPMPSFYTSHYQSRSPPHCSQSDFCKCGREKEDELCCEVCLSSIDVVNSASQRKLVDAVMRALKPIVCPQCNERFADNLSLSSHHRSCHVAEVRRVSVNPSSMTVGQLKEALCGRQLSTTGNKDVLVRRLEGALTNEG